MKQCGDCGAPYPDALDRCPRHVAGKEFAAEPESFEPMLGKTLENRYVIESVLGSGAMGTVYAARHALIDKRVAVKLLREELVNNAQARERFLIEARAASKVTHPNVVDITDFGVAGDGKAFLVMEFLDGRTLGAILREDKQLTPERAISLTLQVARGLHAAHQKAIIHRDLKPDNLFVLPVSEDRAGEHVKIVDFGIAKLTDSDSKLTQAGMVLGTPEYMSPEQALGTISDARADLYALGCILYEMLTGTVPCEGVDPAETLRKQVYEKAPALSTRRPDLKFPPALERVVLKMIEKKPEDRYADLAEVERALIRVASGEDDAPAQGRLRARVAMAVAAAVVVVVAAVITWVSTRSEVAKVAVVKPSRSSTLLDRPNVVDGGDAAPIEVRILSTPAEASIYLGEELLGTTPYLWKISSTATPATVILRKAGYRDSEQILARDRNQQVHANLQRIVNSQSPTETPEVAKRPPRPSPHKPTSPHSRPGKRGDLKNPF